MSIDFNNEAIVCSRCGATFRGKKNNFYICHSSMYKGSGFLPWCTRCVEAVYNKYLAQCQDARIAVRQTCRKLDIYWSDGIFDYVMSRNKSRTVMAAYISRANSGSYSGNSYDDTLGAEGTLWYFPSLTGETETSSTNSASDKEEEETIPEEVIAFWGSGYSPSMYAELEQRRNYYISKLPAGTEIDIGSEALIRQICNLEVSIARDSAAGKSIDKSVNALNTLLGSLNIKPAQQKENSSDADEKRPFGLWIKEWEEGKPIPEVDPELADVDGVSAYVDTWMRGHLAKMLGLKGAYSKLYDETIDRMRIEHPEYDDEDDEDFLADIFDKEEGDES